MHPHAGPSPITYNDNNALKLQFLNHILWNVTKRSDMHATSCVPHTYTLNTYTHTHVDLYFVPVEIVINQNTLSVLLLALKVWAWQLWTGNCFLIMNVQQISVIKYIERSTGTFTYKYPERVSPDMTPGLYCYFCAVIIRSTSDPILGEEPTI